MLAICLIFIFIYPKKLITNININATLSTSTKTRSPPPHSMGVKHQKYSLRHNCEISLSLALGTLLHQSGHFSSSSLTDMINGKCWTFFPSFLHLSEARLRNWNIFCRGRSWKIFIFNCKYFSLKLVFRWQAIWRAWCQVFLAGMILRPDLRDDNTLNVKPHMWPFVLNFSRSKYFQTSLNIFNLFQSSLFDKYFLLPSRYQYSPGANFYIKFSLTAEAIYRWHNGGIIELQTE